MFYDLAMSIGELLSESSTAELFKKKVQADADKLASLAGIDSSVAVLILSETAVLLETDEPKHIQIRRIKASGIKAHDIDYEPSVFEAIEILGVGAAKELYQNNFRMLLKAWRTAKNLESPLPILAATEWHELIGKIKSHFSVNAEAIRTTGVPPKQLEISTLLRFVPKGAICRFEDMMAIAAEIDGQSKNEIIGQLKCLDLNSNRKFEPLLKELRSQLLEFYRNAFELLTKAEKISIEEYAKALATITYRAFDTWEQIEELNEIESSMLGILSGETDGLNTEEIDNLIEEGYFTEANRPVAVPFCIQDILTLSFFLKFETDQSHFADIRTRLTKSITFTDFNFPLLQIDFWEDLSKDKTAFFEKVKIVDECLSIATKSYESFCDSFIKELRHLFATKIELYVSRLACDKSPDSDTADILADLNGISEENRKPRYVKGSEFIFEQDFTVLRWRDKNWTFKDWEGKILEALYLAHENGAKNLTTAIISSIANDCHFKEIKPRKQKLKDSRKTHKENRNTTRYMFKDIFQKHELNHKFIVAGSYKGTYRLNPIWNPEAPEDETDPATRKKKLSKRSLA